MMKRIVNLLCISCSLFLALNTVRADNGPPIVDSSPKHEVNRIQFAPVFVNPQMQWAFPNSNLNGPPAIWLGDTGTSAVMVGVGANGVLYNFDWVSYYR